MSCFSAGLLPTGELAVNKVLRSLRVSFYLENFCSKHPEGSLVRGRSADNNILCWMFDEGKTHIAFNKKMLIVVVSWDWPLQPSTTSYIGGYRKSLWECPLTSWVCVWVLAYCLLVMSALIVFWVSVSRFRQSFWSDAERLLFDTLLAKAVALRI